MAEPSEKEIEAAARAICKHICDDDADWRAWTIEARAALLAAARVREGK